MKIHKAVRKSKLEVFLNRVTFILSAIMLIMIAYMLGSYYGFQEGSTAALRIIYYQVNSGEGMKEAIQNTKEGFHADSISFRKGE